MSAEHAHPDDPHHPISPAGDVVNEHPSDLQLASWLDDRCDDRTRDLLDAHLAACAACRASVVALRSLLDAGTDAIPVAPARVVEAARALVPAEPALVRTHHRSPLVISTRWALRIAACLGICTLGYLAGLGSGDARPGVASEAAGTDMTFGLLELEDDVADLQLFTIVASEVTP